MVKFLAADHEQSMVLCRLNHMPYSSVSSLASSRSTVNKVLLLRTDQHHPLSSASAVSYPRKSSTLRGGGRAPQQDLAPHQSSANYEEMPYLLFSCQSRNTPIGWSPILNFSMVVSSFRSLSLICLLLLYCIVTRSEHLRAPRPVRPLLLRLPQEDSKTGSIQPRLSHCFQTQT
jgi:hypothetical protein